MCGKPRGAREVGWILRRIDASDKAIPWWRVVNNKGVISIKGNWTVSKDLQAKLLQKEGVEVKKDFTFSLYSLESQCSRERPWLHYIFGL